MPAGDWGEEFYAHGRGSGLAGRQRPPDARAALRRPRGVVAARRAGGGVSAAAARGRAAAGALRGGAIPRLELRIAAPRAWLGIGRARLSGGPAALLQRAQLVRPRRGLAREGQRAAR